MGSRVSLGNICSFDRGASVPRVRMHESGNLLYVHYGGATMASSALTTLYAKDSASVRLDRSHFSFWLSVSALIPG